MAGLEKSKTIWDVIGTMQAMVERLRGLNEKLESRVAAQDRTIADLGRQVAAMARARERSNRGG